MVKDNITAKTIEHNAKVRNRNSGKITNGYNEISRENNIAVYKSNKLALNQLLSQSPDILSLLSKAVKKPGVDKLEDTESTVENNQDILQAMYRRSVCKRNRHKMSIELFPDIDTAIDIVISATLSPNKLGETELIYSLNDTDNLGKERVKSKLLSEVSDYIEVDYDISETMEEVAEEVYKFSGCDPRLVISEAVTDDIVNNDLVRGLSTENFKVEMDTKLSRLIEPTNILSGIKTFNTRGTEYSIEDRETIKTDDDIVDYLVSSNNVKVTDNIEVLRLKDRLTSIRSELITDALSNGIGISLESRNNLSNINIFSLSNAELDDTKIKTSRNEIDYNDIFRDREMSNDDKKVIELHSKNKSTRKTLGKPLVVRLPSESVCPVIIPGDKDKHLGYFILLDEKGTPVSSRGSKSSYEQLNASVNKPNFAVAPIHDVYKDIHGVESDCLDIDKFYKMYESKMERQLYELFTDSIYGDHVEISNMNAMMYMLFTRSLQAQKTTILYAPAENLTYFAVNHDDYGVGKTLLDDLSVVMSIRAILLFARITAQLRNCIDITEVDVQLDPEDVNVEGTIEKVKSLTYKLNSDMFPLGEDDPMELVDWISKAGHKFKWSGHPDIPDISIDFNKSGTTYNIPDSELETNIAEQLFTGIGVPGENISKAYSPDFAVQVVKGSVLFNKRIARNQKKLNPQITKYVKSILNNDGVIRERLKKIIRDNMGDISEEMDINTKVIGNTDSEDGIEAILKEFIKRLEVSLPTLYDDEANNIDQEFTNYLEKIEKVLDVVFNEEMFDEDVMSELRKRSKFVRQMVTLIVARKWASENNYLPEIFGIIDGIDNDLEQMVETSGIHYENLYKLVAKVLKEASELTVGETDISKLTTEDTGGGDDSSSSGGFDW